MFFTEIVNPCEVAPDQRDGGQRNLKRKGQILKYNEGDFSVEKLFFEDCKIHRNEYYRNIR